jgi:hypothetical protein
MCGISVRYLVHLTGLLGSNLMQRLNHCFNLRLSDALSIKTRPKMYLGRQTRKIIDARLFSNLAGEIFYKEKKILIDKAEVRKA